jgi:hypothetical protein
MTAHSLASPSEKAWQAESDAQTLAESEVIKSTPSRMKSAKTAAKKMAVEAQKKAVGMKKIGRAPIRKSPSPRRKR